MPTLRSHTHLQAAQANAQTKACKRVCLPNRTTTRQTEGQLVTGGIFYCRDSASFSVTTSNKLSCNLTGQYFEIGNKNIPPNR